MFRNLTLFRFSESVGKSLANRPEFGAALASNPLRDCGPLESFTCGFVSPYGPASDSLTLSINGATFFTIGKQEKLLPAAVLNEAVSKRIRDSAESNGRPLGLRARKRIKAEVLDQLLPRAFVRPSRINGYMDTGAGWVVLDTASRKAAETVLTQLRHALGSFPALPLITDNAPRILLTQWLAHDTLPDGFEFGDECELRDPTGGAIAKCSRQQVENNEVKEHLRSGKQVFRLGLVYRDRLSFVLDDALVLRKLRLLDIAMENLEQECEDATAELQARMALMAGELHPLLSAIASVFGAERPGD